MVAEIEWFEGDQGSLRISYLATDEELIHLKKKIAPFIGILTGMATNKPLSNYAY